MWDIYTEGNPPDTFAVKRVRSGYLIQGRQILHAFA